jgi:hypothetical protein
MAFIALRQLLDQTAVPNTHLVMHGSSRVPQEWLALDAMVKRYHLGILGR